MGDLPPAPDPRGDSGNDTRVRPTAQRPPATPRWVKIFGIIVIVLVLMFVVLHLTGNSPFGGPGGHFGGR